MSARHVGVQWSRKKAVYDLVAVAAVVAWILVYHLVSAARFPGGEGYLPKILGMRAWGTCAFALMTFVLSIGPLARLDRRFLFLLYNRRHLGVLTFLVALGHAWQVLALYHGHGGITWIESLLTHDAAWTKSSLPFQLFGAFALLLLGVLAVTSHDFWQKYLGHRLWKVLHMGIYAAYLAVVAHVAFGVLQFESHPVWTGTVLLSVLLVSALHVVAARRTRKELAAEIRPVEQRDFRRMNVDSWLEVGPVDSFALNEVRAVEAPGGERIAVMLGEKGFTAMEGTCAHQGGPLAEGRVIDGCLTCPWHGWQYRAEDGCAPPPFQEKLRTHLVGIDGEGVVHVAMEPSPEAGHPWPPANPLRHMASPPESFVKGSVPPVAGEFHVGHQPTPPGIKRHMRLVTAAVVGMALLTAAAIAGTQREPAPGTRPYRTDERIGLFVRAPYPHLRYLDGDRVRTLLLVGAGKGGIAPDSAPDGAIVRLKGGVLERDGTEMMTGPTFHPGTAEDELLRARLAGVRDEDRGKTRLRGEVVDSKCYLGAMRPGGGRVHRACAQMCIDGGVPPVLVLRHEDGQETHVLLCSRQERPVNAEVLPFVAEPVAIAGRLVERAGLLILKCDPTSIERR